MRTPTALLHLFFLTLLGFSLATDFVRIASAWDELVPVIQKLKTQPTILPLVDFSFSDVPVDLIAQDAQVLSLFLQRIENRLEKRQTNPHWKSEPYPYLELYLNLDQKQQLSSLNITFKASESPKQSFSIIPRETNLTSRLAFYSSESFKRSYLDYDDLEQFLKDLESPVCKMIQIGTPLASGRKILGMKISDNVNVREMEPQFKYIGNTYEHSGTPFLTDFAFFFFVFGF